MNIRSAALSLFAFALAIAFDSNSAEADKRVLSKAGGGESAGMYSNDDMARWTFAH